CDTARLIITVTAVNDAPIAADDAININEDAQGTGNVLTNDSDPDGDALTASVVANPAHGTIVLNADGSFTYTPNANFNGLDTLTYQACDNNGACDTARLIITVTAMNDAPIAADDAITINEDTQGTGNVLSNDTDADGDPLIASVVNGPSHGTIVLNADGSFTYTPNANFNGLDTLTYQACDNNGACDTARLIITVTAVNDAPIAADDAININEDAQGTGNVLTNDSDPDGDELIASVVVNPAHGTIVLNADGSFTYTPNANFNGLDTLTYQACDNNGACDTARLIITVTAMNDAPIAADDAININEDAQGTGNVLTNDSDADGDPLIASVVNGPSHGTILLNADGSFTYTPNANFNGLDTLTYQACDNNGACDTARLIITVTAMNDAPIAADDAININEDAQGIGNVLTNDSDPDGDALIASVVVNPAHGTIVLNADGSFTYTPNANFNGMDTVSYQACDNNGACDTARLILTVTAMNDTPVAADDAITINEDTQGTGNVLTNDTDPEGDALTANVINAPGNGTIVLNADGSFTYTPNANFNGIDTVTYQSCDNNGACDTARLIITVTAVNDAPVAVDDVITVNEDTNGTGNVLTNDTDPDGNALIASVVTNPAHGTIVLNADGSFSYTPNANFNGIDTVTYQACDNNGACDTARLIITVTAVNDTPVAVDDAITINEDAQGTGNVLTNDTDPDGDALTASVVTNPAHGMIVLNADGSFTYTPIANFNGIDTLTYQACDNNGACDTAHLIITVTAMNDAPMAADDAITINEDTQGTGNVLGNDTDADGDPLIASVVNGPSHGTIVLNADGSFTYTPNANFNGIDTVTYQACDNNGACDTARLIITVTAMNDSPVAEDDAITINEDTQGTGNVLTNDTDPDGDVLTASVVTNPTHGTIVLNADGSFTYTPDTNFNGIDTVTYQACDNNGGCDTARLIITVTAVNDAPIATDDAITIAEDSQGTGNVLTNDTDPDGEALTASVVTNPAHGTIVLNTDGSFNYTPNANFNGIDTVTYQACDNNGACDTAHLIITVTAMNDAPVATDDAITIVEDTNGAGNVLTNDTDPDGDALTASVITSPAHGTIVLNADGSFSYTPNANFNGLDTVTYQACDNIGGCDTARLIITVTAANDAPIATDDAITINEDIQGTANVLTNDTDSDGDALSASVVTNPVHGIIVLNADGSFTYTPNANFNGLDTVTYQACDINGACDTARLIITVTAMNDAPIAVDDAITINEDAQGTGNILTNDSDPDGDALTASVVANPAHGTIVLNADGSFTYTPNANFNGLDTLTYQACDNNGACDTARLIITVTAMNDAPIAADDAITINEDSQGTGNVLTNDSDPDGDALTASVVTNPAHGTIVLNADGSFTYTPNANFNGIDTVTYQACDNNGGCDTARLIITVTATNDAPVATDDAITIVEDTNGAGNVLTNDTDSDGDALTASVITSPAHGTIVLNADGSFSYTPTANFNGLDTVTYQACDNIGACDSARLIITVTAMNDAPVATDDVVTIVEDTNGTGNVLTNDTDPDGDALTVSVVTDPVHGTIVLNADGSFTYTPNANFNGLDTVIYQACDNNGGCDTASLIITVTAMNDAPMAADDAVTINEDAQGTGNVLTNDIDPDGDALTASVVTNPAHGTIVLNADGSFTYTPNANFNGLDTLTYQACDNNGACDTAHLIITVTAMNDAPIAVDDAITINEDTQGTGNVLSNDTDPDGDALTASVVTNPAYGTIILNAGGSFTYTPNANFNGIDTVTYQACDNNGDCDTARLIIAVAAANDAPVATDDAITIVEDTNGAGNVLSNDTDPDGDALTASVVTNPAHGTIVLNADGSFTYTPNANFNGLDTVTYQACDNNGACDTARLIITVSTVNDAPVAVDDAITINEDAQGTGNVLTNDTDPDGDALTASVVTNPVHGIIVLNADGSFTYTPNGNFNGLDTLTYQACDNIGACDTARLIITVTAMNDAPVAVDDAITIYEDAQGTGNVLTNDTDPDGEALAVSVVTNPVYGTIVLNADGSFTYTPNANFNGIDTVAYQACDNNGGCDTALLIITVIAMNDAPVATDDAITIVEDTNGAGNVLTNDTDS
ncbi:Ig-like domain-containing protein, partial [Chitinophaga silvisoli]